MKTLRVSSLLASTRVTKHAAQRSFSSAGRRQAATNFTMPALSPTMTEGNIAKWQVKEGDSFTAGQVLLEIETDKATMDVEAQDDGIVMKITAPSDSKGVQVGARIAVIAEPGDDISSLDLPADESPKQASTSQEKEQEKSKGEEEQPKKESKPQPSKGTSSQSQSQEQTQSSSSNQSGTARKQKYPLYPSVQHLLHENGLSDSAADEIPATGPNGRLLKGDVLAYLGRIDKSYPGEASARLLKLSHLDLSNIQLAEPKPKPSKSSTAEPETLPEQPKDIDLALPISLTAAIETQKRVEQLLNTTVPLSVLIARASELANEDLPLPKQRKVTSNELFNAVLGLPASAKTSSRGRFVPQLSTIDLTDTRTPHASVRQPDIIDMLTNTSSSSNRSSRRHATRPSTAQNDLFSVTTKPGEEKRAMVYLERLKTVLEKDPGRLVI